MGVRPVFAFTVVSQSFITVVIAAPVASPELPMPRQLSLLGSLLPLGHSMSSMGGRSPEPSVPTMPR